MSLVLEMERVTAFYGLSQALFGVSLVVGEGQVVALLGRNGMGKTTTVRTVTRLLPHRDGLVRVAGRDVAGLRPHQVARLGVGLVPEGRRCFPNLTVEENLLASARPGAWDIAAVGRLFPRLAERRRQSARSLSGGEQQMLALGRALMTNPRLLVLDEATEGLAPVVRREIWGAIATLKQSGLAILLVDKSLKELLAIADGAVVLERGRSVWRGASAALTAELCRRYLGV